MTKKIAQKISTQDKIVETALKMFNAKGIEYVGMREIAEAAGLRIGNLTYYFPTKDALVNRLSEGLALLNDQTIIANELITMQDFFRMLDGVFANHVTYRCLLLSFVHIMERNAIISRNYNKTQTRRVDVWRSNIVHLQRNKYIRTRNSKDIDFLVSAISLIARFWISESAISQKNMTHEQQRAHYLSIVAKIFEPFATPKGLKELKAYF